MDRNDEVIQTHPLVGWDISTVDVYDAMMIRLHYLSSLDQTAEEAQVDRTLWLTTDVARQFDQYFRGWHRQDENLRII